MIDKEGLAMAASSPHTDLGAPLVDAALDPACRACIVVPIRNEADEIETTLQALLHQTTLDGSVLDPACYEVIVLANNCTDPSPQIVEQFAAQHPRFRLHLVDVALPAQQAFVGTARRLAMDEAYRRFATQGQARGVIASTDGDTRVAATWVAATLHEVARGAEGVGGDIQTSVTEQATLDEGTRHHYLLDVAYQQLCVSYGATLDDDPTNPAPAHAHHTGASLAVTARAYGHVGGLPALRTGEDVALYRALRRADLPFRHSPLVSVTTSARRDGRAYAGMADTLSAWGTLAHQRQSRYVDSSTTLAAQAQLRRWLRDLWSMWSEQNWGAAEQAAALGETFGIDPCWLNDVLDARLPFGATYDIVLAQYCCVNHWSQVEITDAIAEFRERLGYHSEND